MQTFKNLKGVKFTEKDLLKEIEIYRTSVIESLVGHELSYEVAKKTLEDFYRLILKIDFPKDDFFIFDSPFQAWKWIQENKCENPKEGYVETYAIDIRNAGYYHFCEFALKNKFCEITEKIEKETQLGEKLEMALNMLHFSKVFPFDDCCIVALNPVELHFNAQGVLHNENGMSCKFKDETGLYNLNGIPVPEYAVLTKKEDFTKEMILSEKNADVRREILRKIGNEKMLELFDANILDAQDDYKLLEIIIDGRGRKYLMMKNPSVNLTHVEGVPNEVKNVNEALAWRNGLKEYVKPVSLT